MDAYCLKPDELPDLTIEKLGLAIIDHPLRRGECHFVDDGEKVLVYTNSECLQACAHVREGRASQQNLFRP
jgi:hypothetical protein